MKQPRNGKVGILSDGLWAKREAIQKLVALEPVRVQRWRRNAFEAIAGWGNKGSAQQARKLAADLSIPYIAIEDGFLRSVYPGDDGPTIGWVVDRTGIYYDASMPCDLETAIIRRTQSPNETDRQRTRNALDQIRKLRLSKYNHAPMLTHQQLGLPLGRDFIYVIDQTEGDASVPGAGASAANFQQMLEVAIDENPGRTVVVKLHPETISGKKKGYLPDYCRTHNVKVITENVNPWALIESAYQIYVVSSQVGLEALLANVPVTCFGAAFYAGWGLTDDRTSTPKRRTPVKKDDLASAIYLDYCHWMEPKTGHNMEIEDAIELLAGLKSVCQ